MENKKEEAIRIAYGDYWYKMSPELQSTSLSSDGWIQMRGCIKELGAEFSLSQNLSTEPHFNSSKQRPKSLQGIENNNGWISIESEEDLPPLEDDSEFWIANENGIFDFTAYSLQVQRKWENKTLTHYQKIVKPKPPIY